MNKISTGKILNSIRNWLKKISQPEVRVKIISLGIAILLHLALILYLRQAKIIIKILPFGKKTEVVIAKYPEVSIPRNLEEIIKQPPVSEELLPAGKPGEKGQGPGASGVPARPGGRPSPTKGGVPPAQAMIPFDLESYLASGREQVSPPFGLKLTLSSRLKPSSGKYSFSLKLRVSPAQPLGPGQEETQPKLKSDVYRYAAPRAYTQPGKGLRFSPYGQPRPGVPGSLSGFQAAAGYKYDIKPWAQKVVTLIQTKWVLPQLGVMPKSKNVAMVLVVDREGQLVSLEITNSTTSEILDQAAISAVRQCAPFPPLPADFPGKSLEFYLVFTYHD